MSDKTIELPLVLFAITEWGVTTKSEDRVVQLTLLNPSRCTIDSKIINYAFTKLKEQLWRLDPGMGIARLSLGTTSEFTMIGLGKEKELAALIAADAEAEDIFVKFMGMGGSKEIKTSGEEPGPAYVNQ